MTAGNYAIQSFYHTRNKMAAMLFAFGCIVCFCLTAYCYITSGRQCNNNKPATAIRNYANHTLPTDQAWHLLLRCMQQGE